jgi:hypothetical protein
MDTTEEHIRDLQGKVRDMEVTITDLRTDLRRVREVKDEAFVQRDQFMTAFADAEKERKRLEDGIRALLKERGPIRVADLEKLVQKPVLTMEEQR